MNTEFKTQIKETLLCKNGNVNSACIREKRGLKHKTWIDVIKHTSFLPDDARPQERIYCALNDIIKRPACPICGNEIKFSKQLKRYNDTCNNMKCVCKHRGFASTKEALIKSHTNARKEFFDFYHSDFEPIQKEQCCSYIQTLLRNTDYGRKHQFVDDRKYKNDRIILASIVKYTFGDTWFPLDLSKKQWSERFYILMHNITERPTCPICGKTHGYINYEHGYRKFCPSQCVGSIRINHNKTIEEKIKEQGFEILEFPSKINYGTFVLKCNKCGKTIKKVLKNGKWKDIYCEGCFGDVGVSRGEKEVLNYVKQILPNELIVENHSIDGLELDIYIPNLKIGIEFDGVYWHSFKFSGKNRMKQKNELFKKHGISVIHFFDHEWNNKKEIVKSMIANKLHAIKTKFYARNLTVKPVPSDEKNTFLENNHIQGKDNSKYAIGLYDGDKLLSIMTFGCRKITGSKSKFELIRFCVERNCIVIGAASKLLKHFEREHQKELKNKTLTTYANKRYSNGSLYNVLGFTYSHDSLPNYFYTKGGQMFSRIAFQKHKLHSILNSFDPNKTERENMTANGYNTVYDCGNMVFEKTYQ